MYKLYTFFDGCNVLVLPLQHFTFISNQIVLTTMKRMLNRMLRYADAIVKRGVDKLIDTIAHNPEPQTKNAETQAKNASTNGGDASRVGKIYSYYLVEFVFPSFLYPDAGRVAPISDSVFLQRVFKQLKNASKWSRQEVYFERPACKGKSITILCALEFYQAIIISILHHSYALYFPPLTSPSRRCRRCSSLGRSLAMSVCS